MRTPRLILAIRVALHWNRATDLASKRRHSEALAEISSIERILKSMPCRFHLFKATLLHKLDRLEEAWESYRIAHALADAARGWGYSKSIRAYIKCYAAAYGMPLQASLRRDPDPSMIVDYSSVNLREVPDYFRRTFPFSLHPDWKNLQQRKKT
jgi:hypothetical protein